MIDIANIVTLSGRLSERPSYSETETGELTAAFWLHRGNNAVWCICRGPAAQSAKRFAHAGIEVLAHGRLTWPSNNHEQPHVLVDRLAFTNPREVAELLGWDLN